MALAGGYVLHLSSDRRSVFEETFGYEETFAEPVEDFNHARSAPLICFVVLDGSQITHIAKGRRGIAAGTGLRRLNVEKIHELNAPVFIDSVVNALGNNRTRKKATEVLRKGGFFTPKAFESAIDAISEVSEESVPLLQRFSRTYRDLIAKLTSELRRTLGEQKETVLTALEIAGLDRKEIHDWSPPRDSKPASFLDGLPSAVMREDAMIVNDLRNVPGMKWVRDLPYSAALFEGEGKRLTVLLANRLPLEQLTGTDLIYFNETYRSFVMVQYKAMEHSLGDTYFRLPNAGLDKEILRMQEIERQLQTVDVGRKENFRLDSDPFYIKLCSRMQFNPDDIKLFPGMYFSLEHWRLVADDLTLVGPRGGRRVTYENAGRYINNDLFIKLVANAWIGSHAEQSALLESAIRDTLASGRAVTLAVEKAA